MSFLQRTLILAHNTHIQKRVVIANCGSSATKKQLSAQLQLFEDYEKVEKHGTKPKKTVELSYAKVSAVSTGSPSGSQTNSPAGAVTGVSISPSPSPSPRNSLTLSTSPSIHSLSLQSGTSHRFLVITSNETHEFRTETENDRLRWVKLLGLLVMFPFSVIPEEPQSNPIKESFRWKLDPVQYRAGTCIKNYLLFHKCNCVSASNIAAILHFQILRVTAHIIVEHVPF